jgi:probable rRNA maturation factor
MRVRTVLTEDAREVPRRTLALLARRVMRGEEGDLDVTIVLTDDARLRELNRRYRGIDRATDVLSFDLPALPPVVGPTGELYISVSQARRQARRYRHSLTAELERLVVHGVLHLLGHDHKRSGDARRMRSREEAYLMRRVA